MNCHDAEEMQGDTHQVRLDDGLLDRLLCGVVEAEERIRDVDLADCYDSPLDGRRAAEVEPKTYGTDHSTVMLSMTSRLGVEVTVRTW